MEIIFFFQFMSKNASGKKASNISIMCSDLFILGELKKKKGRGIGKLLKKKLVKDIREQ